MLLQWKKKTEKLKAQTLFKAAASVVKVSTKFLNNNNNNNNNNNADNDENEEMQSQPGDENPQNDEGKDL